MNLEQAKIFYKPEEPHKGGRYCPMCKYYPLIDEPHSLCRGCFGVNGSPPAWYEPCTSNCTDSAEIDIFARIKDVNAQVSILWKLKVNLDNCVMCISDKEKMGINILETDFGRIPIVRSKKLNKGEFAFLREGEIAVE
jgi:hypothetical protein